MKYLKYIMLFPILAVIISACQGSPHKEETGTLMGGILGGVLASNLGEGSGNTAAIIGGTMLGAYFGNSVGASLDRADRLYMQRAQSSAYLAPIGQQINWNNPKTGHQGYITPTKDGTSVRGEYCREFQQTVLIAGQTQQVYGTACQQRDGTWKIVN